MAQSEASARVGVGLSIMLVIERGGEKDGRRGRRNKERERVREIEIEREREREIERER